MAVDDRIETVEQPSRTVGADAAVLDVAVVEQLGPLAAVGDRVAHEDDLRIAHLAVGLLEAAEVRPVLGLRSGAEQTRKGKDGKKQFFHRFSSY